MKALILDCSLRDGGYYNNWDFNDDFVINYLKESKNLPIDFLEVGYISHNIKGYQGRYFYLDLDHISWIKDQTDKSLAVMIDVKNVSDFSILKKKIIDLREKVKLIRLATDFSDFNKAIKLTKEIKSIGFQVAINIMRFGQIDINSDFFEKIELIKSDADYLYLVDSYGDTYPKDLRKTIKSIKRVTNIKLGFHGHNNLELAFSNTLTAIEEGVEIIDGTFSGMGRGAGNLKLELLIIYLHSKLNKSFTINNLPKIVQQFEILKKEFQWGTNLPYMISGAYSKPQKEVMDLVSLNRYSFDSIIRTVSKNKINKFKIFNPKINPKEAIIVGGGDSVKSHLVKILKYLQKNKETIIIYCTSKHIKQLEKAKNYKIFAVSGDETIKHEGSVKMNNFVIAPSPRIIEPQETKKVKYEELKSIDFTNKYLDSSLSIALQIALDIKVDEINLIGFDGYKNFKSRKESLLFKETQEIISRFSANKKLNSLTYTLYNDVNQKSIYQD